MDLGSLIDTSTPISGATGWVLVLIAVWTLIWKGLALWRASKRNDSTWFVVLLVINTIGILDMIYYFLIAKTDKKK
ncbi:MAG: DUF5652 family protein [Patescibacteria group bacterium]